MVKLKIGLSYDDVLLVPKNTPLKSRGEADTRTRLTKNIELNLPLVSANMATVTEHKMAIAMAREGGLGVIHQFMPIEEQVEEVKKVKRITGYFVENPITVSRDIKIKDAVEVMNEKGVTSLLITAGDELVGIFTLRDYLFEDNLDLPVSEVMTPKEKLVTAEFGISLEDAKKIIHHHRIEKLPLLRDGKLVGLITTKDIKKLEYWPNSCRDEKGRLRVGAAVGVKDTFERTGALIDAGVDVIVLDVAHAHSENVIEKLRELKSKFSVDVVVGNIATGEAAKELIKAGADALKVGVGPSPVCSTRLITGAGIPQLSAIMEVSKVAKKFNIPVWADGGLKYPGDIVKAIAGGADVAFSGSFFAGTDEAPGFIILKDGKRYKRYIGSASYDSSHERREKVIGKRLKEKINVFVEGVSALVDYKGSVGDMIESLMKGFKSGMSYCGARNIKEMKENAEFIRMTSKGLDESKTRGHKVSD